MSNLEDETMGRTIDALMARFQRNPDEFRALMGMGTMADAQANAAARETREQTQEAAIAALQGRTGDATTTTKGITWFAGDGQATEGRAVQANDSRLKLATTTANGLMSAADKTKLDGLGKTNISSGTVAIPVLILGASAPLTITFAKPMQTTTYAVLPVPFGISTAAYTLTEVSRSKTGIVLTIKAGLAITVGATLQVIVFEEV